VGRITALGVEALALFCDLRQEESVRAAVAAAAARFGRLDIVVNNAGVFEQTPLEAITTPQWDAVFETNTRGPFLVVREALPHLRQAHGRIVNLTSLGGAHAWAGHAHYCASKAALEMLTKTMAKALAPEITANCVAPGWIDAAGEGGPLAERFAAKTPMRRTGAAEEVAEAVYFFVAGPGFITGQTLAVDGGLGL
jgi:pteridine reductase